MAEEEAAITAWLAAVTWDGPLAHLSAHLQQQEAEQQLFDFLQRNHGYAGSHDARALQRWVNQHDRVHEAFVTPRHLVVSPDLVPVSTVERFLRERGFVTLTHNAEEGHYEAWAYQGPLDWNTATAVRFGIGPHLMKSLEALNHQLSEA